jgi:hypothetical protein
MPECRASGIGLDADAQLMGKHSKNPLDGKK